MARTVRVLPLLALLLAPLPAAAWKCPARGGREWREARSEHFRLVTDASSGKAKDLLGELETLHLAVRSALFRSPPPLPGVLQVIAFKDVEDFRTFASPGAVAYYTEVDGDPTVVMTASLGPYARNIIAHELTHHLLGRVFARQPLWFAEGVASFLETIGGQGEFTEDDFASRNFLAPGTFIVGTVPRHRLSWLQPWTGGLHEVLVAKGLLPGVRDYSLAWSLTYFLVQTHPREFGDLQGRLARGQDPGAAWLEVFPQWNPSVPEHMQALDDAVGKYLASGRFASRRLEVPKQEPQVAERVLASPEVHTVRLALSRRGLSPEQATASFAAERDEALAEDPGHVLALRSLATATPADGPALAAKATGKHPEDPRAWRLAGDHAAEPGARESAYRKAVELAPDDDGALNQLAWFLVTSEREGEALPIARKAAALGPGDSAILDTYAAALQALGMCGEALQVQRRAVDVLPERLGAEGRKAYLARLDALEGTCGSKRAASAGQTAPPPASPPAPAATAAPAAGGPAPASP